MYRTFVCDSALSLPGNYKAHVRMFHGNERSNDRIFPPLKNNRLSSIEEEYCSTAETSTMSDLQWPLVEEEEYRARERNSYGVDMLGVMIDIPGNIIRMVLCVNRASSWNGE